MNLQSKVTRNLWIKSKFNINSDWHLISVEAEKGQSKNILQIGKNT